MDQKWVHCARCLLSRPEPVSAYRAPSFPPTSPLPRPTPLLSLVLPGPHSLHCPNLQSACTRSMTTSEPALIVSSTRKPFGLVARVARSVATGLSPHKARPARDSAPNVTPAFSWLCRKPSISSPCSMQHAAICSRAWRSRACRSAHGTWVRTGTWVHGILGMPECMESP